MVKFFRKKSKRMSCRKKYKIEKKVREHKKKLKKEAKKNPRKSKPKDPGLPNSLPFKNQILLEAQEHKKRAEELRQRQKEDRQRLVAQKRGLSDLREQAEREARAFENKTAEEESSRQCHPSLKAYYKEFSKVVEASDIILEVLDARDPLGSRCPQVEQHVLNAGTKKRLVLVINKIDLIPRENLVKWLHYLRNDFPTVAFKASTQTQQSNLAHSKVSVLHSSDSLKKSSRCLGASMLMKLLGNYCCNNDIKTSIIVGVVGFPNVGKSSIINSLKRNRACTVGATPGVTKALQEIQLDKHIKLLDSPGVIMSKSVNESNAALRNAIKVESIEDPITPVESILQRANKEQMMLRYRLPEFSTPLEFLGLLAKRLGRLKKGGLPDIEAAAKKLLNDWNVGKIKYYTLPPETHQLPAYISSEIVEEMGKEFCIDDLQKDEEDEFAQMSEVMSTDAIEIETGGPTDAVIEENTGKSDEEAMSEDDAATGNHMIPEARQIELSPCKEKAIIQEDETHKLPKELQLKKARRQALKRKKRQRKRNAKLADKLADSLESTMALSTSENYDFATDFT